MRINGKCNNFHAPKHWLKPVFMIIVELDRKKHGKEEETWTSCTCRQRPTLAKCQKMSGFLKANTCMT